MRKYAVPGIQFQAKKNPQRLKLFVVGKIKDVIFLFTSFK